MIIVHYYFTFNLKVLKLFFILILWNFKVKVPLFNSSRVKRLVLKQSNGAMWICGFVDLWIRGQSVHRSHVDLWICGFGAKSRSTFKT